MSAFQSLPPEVLSDIFLRSLPDPSQTNFKLDLPPWTIARVCRKWRYVCLSTPRLWLHIPAIFLNHEHKPGFFELLKIMMKLSFPYNLHLRIRDTNSEKIQHFENILPRIDSLSFYANLPMIEALAQRKQSFNHLKYAGISFDMGTSSQVPPRLDFLAEVNTLHLCYHPLDLASDTTPYALLRSVDLQLTTFGGLNLPIIYLQKFLSAAPLLQKVTMAHLHDGTTIDSVITGPPPTSILRHTNLKILILISDGFPSYHELNYLCLPKLQRLYLGSCESGYTAVLPFFAQTQGSILKLHLTKQLDLPGHQRTWYSLCPHVEELSLSYAGAEDLKNLTITTGSRLCPALRHLSMPGFTLDDDTGAQILEEFLSSRGLVPFSALEFPPDCRRLESVEICTSDDNTLSIFQRMCLKIDDRVRETIKALENNVRPWISIPALQ